MGTFSAVAVYIALNVMLNVGLALRVIQLRYLTRTSGGGGGHPGLEWAIRAHGNNAEYAPFALAALIFLALLDAPTPLVHSIGLSYTVGRCLVAWAHGWSQGRGQTRRAGMVLTFLGLLTAAVALLVLATELDT
jgi:hypothetical protein